MSDPNIPNLPITLPQDQKVFFQALKFGIELLFGQGRNRDADRALRVSEYERLNKEFQDSLIPIVETGFSGEIPDPPSNLVVIPGMWHHELSWDNPVDEDKIVSHIEIWVAINTQSRDQALLRGIVTITDEMRGGKGYFTYFDFSPDDDVVYWIRSISYGGNHSVWCPPDVQGGYVVEGEGTLADIITNILDVLNGQITVTQLHDLLSSEIEKITGDGPGSVNARIQDARNAIQAQINEINDIDDYDSGTPYVVGNLVKHDGKIYRCTQGTTGNAPPDDDYWSLVGEYSSIAEMVADNYAEIQAINFIDVTSTSAAAVQLAGLVSQITDPDTGLAKVYAEILQEKETRANADGAFASRLDTLDATFNHPDSGMTTTMARLATEVSVWANAAEAGATNTSNMIARIEDSEAAIARIDGVITNPDGTKAWSTLTLETSTGEDLVATVERNVESIDGIEANYTVKVNNNGVISGFGLLSTARNGTPTSAFEIMADTFRVVTASGTKAPFVVGTVEGVSQVAINGNMFVDGTTFSNIVYAGKLRLDSTKAPSAAYTIPTGNWGSQTSHFSCRSSSSVVGFTCEKTNSGDGSALFGYCSSVGQTGAAVAGYNLSLVDLNIFGSKESYGGFFHANAGYGVVGVTNNPFSYGVYTQNKLYAQGGVSPFTGSHVVYSNDSNFALGELVYSIDAWCFHISQNLIIVARSVTPQEKRIVGVVSEIDQPLMKHILKNKLISEQLEEGGEWTIKPEYQSYVDMLIDGNYKQLSVNALGEGGILVCNDNGDIDNGDYLCSANTPGHAMKQTDDLLHNYTVSKALESVIWANEPNTTKLIACTYHCG